MSNLPLNTTICGNTLYHEGNHNEYGTPHEQYLSKWNQHQLYLNKSNTINYYEIIEINSELDNNRLDNYVLLFTDIKNNAMYNLMLTLNPNGDMNTMFTFNEVIDLYYTKDITVNDNGKKQIKIKLFVKYLKQWQTINVSLISAVNTLVWNYPHDYAYKSISFLNNEHTSLNATIVEKNNLRIKKTAHSWGEFTIQGNSKYRIEIPYSFLKWNSNINVTFTVEIPSEVFYVTSINIERKEIIVNMRNTGGEPVTIPNQNIIVTCIND